MWANIYSSSVIVVNHMAVKLKREAVSLELDIQTFIIKPVISKVIDPVIFTNCLQGKIYLLSTNHGPKSYQISE